MILLRKMIIFIIHFSTLGLRQSINSLFNIAMTLKINNKKKSLDQNNAVNKLLNVRVNG